MKFSSRLMLLAAAGTMAAAPVTSAAAHGAAPLSLANSPHLMSFTMDQDGGSSEGFWSFEHILLILGGVGAALTAGVEFIHSKSP